eukprot:scaffold13976_cov28-Tisochrysis_lutea.AAC.2
MAYAQVQIYEHAQPQIQNYKHAQPQAWHAHLQLHINKHAQPQAWHAHLQEQLHGAEQWAMAGTYRGQWHAQAKAQPIGTEQWREQIQMAGICAGEVFSMHSHRYGMSSCRHSCMVQSNGGHRYRLMAYAQVRINKHAQPQAWHVQLQLLLNDTLFMAGKGSVWLRARLMVQLGIQHHQICVAEILCQAVFGAAVASLLAREPSLYAHGLEACVLFCSFLLSQALWH